MFVKLTHNGTPTIFNVNNIVSFRLDIEPKSGASMTKVFLTSGAHTFVDEDVKELHKLLNNPGRSLSYEYEVPAIPDRFEDQYNREMSSPKSITFDRPKRTRQYNARPSNSPFQEQVDRW